MRYTRYKNRKIYCTEIKKYVTLHDVLVDENAVVVDKKTGNDITLATLFAALVQQVEEDGSHAVAVHALMEALG